MKKAFAEVVAGSVRWTWAVRAAGRAGGLEVVDDDDWLALES